MSVTLHNGLIVSDGLASFLEGHQSQLRVARYLMDGWVAQNIIRVDRANHLDVVEEGEDCGKMSYLPPNRWERYKEEAGGYWDSSDPFQAKGRMRGKSGSMLRKILTDECFTAPIPLKYNHDHFVPPLSDEDVLQFVTAMQAAFRPVETFIVTGEAIRYWYYEGNYTETSHSMLHLSCMRYGDNRTQLRLYAQNPRTIGMACILGSDGLLAARALLWNSPKGIIMDRRYGTDVLRRSLVNVAKAHGWAYRTHNDPGEYHITSPDGESGFGSTIVPLHVPWGLGDVPYPDTYRNLLKVRATGDMHYEETPRHIAHEPYVYHGLAFGNIPDTFRARDYRRADEGVRNERVNVLSDFSAIQEWPADLLRSNPLWKLEDPEDDDANFATLPERRTIAVVIDPPPPRPATPWLRTTGTSANVTTAFTTHLAALRDLMNADAGASAPAITGRATAEGVIDWLRDEPY